MPYGVALLPWGYVPSTFLRFRSLHGASSAHIFGHYCVDERCYRFTRSPGCNPVFVPSSSSPWADAVAGQSLALDFLPQPGSGDCWELADCRSGLLLLLNAAPPSHLLLFDAAPPSRLVISDPLTRRYRLIPPSAWFHGCDFLGAFLFDGEAAAAAGACISLSNFRVTCALYRHGYGIARAYVFSSASGGRWTSGAACRSTALCGTSSGRAMGSTASTWQATPLHRQLVLGMLLPCLFQE
ncbi:uncharacterized protein LOC119309956 [Triticum dicoccoides]|uniref:uncharacterized protein LOC119309956 n=1 Tax=Triticum dicoccoides TaxID=85692 RepID=UPI00189139D8|nr:uncharacterized protein LOC119309956 [Triticum dicoccoides]